MLLTNANNDEEEEGKWRVHKKVREEVKDRV